MIKCNECGKEDIGYHKCEAEQPDILLDNIVRRKCPFCKRIIPPAYSFKNHKDACKNIDPYLYIKQTA